MDITVIVERGILTMPISFEDLKKGDKVVGTRGPKFTVGEDAHLSGDASYNGYIVYDTEGNSYFPEDFVYGVERPSLAEKVKLSSESKYVYKLIRCDVNMSGIDVPTYVEFSSELTSAQSAELANTLKAKADELCPSDEYEDYTGNTTTEDVVDAALELFAEKTGLRGNRIGQEYDGCISF